MLGIPDRLRDSIDETNHVVLPVSNVVANLHSENNVPLVECIEIHIEGIYRAISVIVDNDRTAGDSIRLAGTVWFDTGQPGWVFGDVVFGSQVDPP